MAGSPLRAPVESSPEERSYPPWPRIAAAVMGLVVLAALAGQAGQAARAGRFLTPGAIALVALPFLAFLGLLALRPGLIAGWLRRVSRADLRQPGHAWALLLLAATTFAFLGYGAIVGAASAFEEEVLLGQPPGSLTQGGVLAGVVVNTVVLVAPAWVYVAVVHGGGPVAALQRLGLRLGDWPREVLLGAGVALGFLLALAGVGYVAQALGVAVPENDKALEIAGSVGLWGAFALAVGAAFGEEVFFRGFLQERVGLVGQALVFMSGHLAYLNVAQLVVTFTLALAFGLVYKWRGSLAAPMVAHFLFNFVMLTTARLGGQG